MDDLRLTFDNLRTYDIRLNPEKCVSAFQPENYLGSSSPIEELKRTPLNPSLVTVGNTNRPQAGPKISWVRGSFKPFYSRLGEKVLPLYRLLRRTDHFVWTNAATAGLGEIKALLASNPILAAPNIGEPMLLYISATHQVVSAVLIIEQYEEGHKFPL